MSDQPFTIGIEEEYLLVDAETLDLAEAPEAMMKACRAELGDQVTPEFLRCQIEVGTKVCANVDEAKADLTRLRGVIARIAADHGLAPIAAACHPTAEWSKQTHSDRKRYNELHEDLAAIGDRMLVCGMHVHVGIPDDDLRIDLMNQASYFLPHLLALSASSPFWQGRDTGLASYRVGIIDNLPRTGLPPRLESWAAYRRAVDTIIATGMIEDASKIWWDLRPSEAYSTLEVRICDVCPRLDQALSLAAASQSVLRMLWRLRGQNQRWRIYETFLIAENRWRAQRYGAGEGLIDLGRGAVQPMDQLIEELIVLVGEDARALGCADYLTGLRDLSHNDISAERQRAVFRAAREEGASEAQALRAVTASLVTEFTAHI